jgi:hypothetical protein
MPHAPAGRKKANQVSTPRNRHGKAGEKDKQSFYTKETSPKSFFSRKYRSEGRVVPGSRSKVYVLGFRVYEFEVFGCRGFRAQRYSTRIGFMDLSSGLRSEKVQGVE